MISTNVDNILSAHILLTETHFITYEQSFEKQLPFIILVVQ